MSPTSREAPELKKGSAVSSPSEDLNAMIQTVRKRTGESNTEFKSGMPPDSCDEDSTPSRVQLRSAKPSKQQQASMLDMNDNSDCDLWLYKDHLGCVHGPFSGACMFSWLASGYFRTSLPVKRTCDQDFQLLGQLMTTLGRLPFTADPTLQNQPSYSTDKLQAAGATLAALSPDPENEEPPLNCNGKFFKGELLAEDNHTNGSLKEEVEQREGAWGGYEKCQTARSFVSEVATQPAERKNMVCRRTSTAAVDTPAAPTTWAEVCLKAPTKPQCGHVRADQVGTPEPVAIENMTRFPSLGGKAFARALQSKSRNQRQDPAWTRRAAADQDFTRWCYDRLGRLPSYVHVPTFFELLREVDSNSEIEEYVRQHFGSGEEASRFAHEFVQRRLQWKQLTG
ncbi:hypothetical protein MRX96_012921 [Rhipicephalus microplus]